MKKVLIFGALETGLNTLVRAITKIDSSVEVLAVTSTDPVSDIMEGTVATDEPDYNDHLIQNYREPEIINVFLIKGEDYYFREEKEQFFLKNHILKNVPTIKNHRIQIRNTLPQRIRVNEKK